MIYGKGYVSFCVVDSSEVDAETLSAVLFYDYDGRTPRAVQWLDNAVGQHFVHLDIDACMTGLRGR